MTDDRELVAIARWYRPAAYTELFWLVARHDLRPDRRRRLDLKEER